MSQIIPHFLFLTLLSRFFLISALFLLILTHQWLGSGKKKFRLLGANIPLPTSSIAAYIISKRAAFVAIFSFEPPPPTPSSSPKKFALKYNIFQKVNPISENARELSLEESLSNARAVCHALRQEHSRGRWVGERSKEPVHMLNDKSHQLIACQVFARNDFIWELLSQ